MIAEATIGSLRSYRLVMATIFAGSIAVGSLILPGQNERVAMLERDGHSRQALAILEELFGSGDRRYNTLYQMQQLYEDEGNIPKARQFLETMVEERPRDPALRRKLAQFYRNTHDDASYLKALKAQIDVRYSEASCRDLVGFLRLQGDYVQEQSALQMCRQKGYRRPDDLSRLADLLAAGDDTGQAAALLRSIDDLRRLTSPREKFLLLTLLLDQEQPKEAERRSLRWIHGSKDETLALGLIEILARSRYPASAIEVAKDAGTPGDSISLTVAERLIEQSQSTPARLYLRGWLDKAQSASSDTAARFLSVAIAAGDAEIAYSGAKKFGFSMLPRPALLRLQSMLANASLTDAAADVALAVAQSDAPLPVPSVSEGSVSSNLTTDSSAGHSTAGLGPSSGRAGQRPIVRDSQAPKDVLEPWRKAMNQRMAEDALRRQQASLIGPPVPIHLSGHHFQHRVHRNFSHIDAKVSNIKLFKKTSKVLLRAKKNRLLKNKRPPTKDLGKGESKGSNKNELSKEQ